MEGKVWEVQVNVTYKYDKLVDAKVREMGIDKNKYPHEVLGLAPDLKAKLGEFACGIDEGDNLMVVDNTKLDIFTGGITYFQGGNLGLTTSGALVHETGHLLGFDERYTQGGKTKPHLFFQKDYMRNAEINPIAGTAIRGTDFDNSHYVDLLDFALRNVAPNTTKAFTTDNKDNLFMIDNTSGGKTQMTEQDYQEQVSRVVNK